MNWKPERVVPALAAMLALLVLASCASVERRHADGVAFELSYGFYTLDPRSFRMVPIEFSMPPDGLVLVFPAVPGAIMGAPRGAPLRTVPVEQGTTFELRLPGTLTTHAAPFDSDSLKIEPGDTRVARLGTFHEYPDYGVFRGGGGFIDTRSGASVLLVYFSNPATLRGRVRDPTGTYRYDVNVERAGWSWLTVREQADRSFRVETYEGALGTIEFGVLLPPAMLVGHAGISVTLCGAVRARRGVARRSCGDATLPPRALRRTRTAPPNGSGYGGPSRRCASSPWGAPWLVGVPCAGPPYPLRALPKYPHGPQGGA